MDSYTLIFVRDAHARPVQLAIPKKRVMQTVIGVVVAALVLLVGLWDYWRVRADNRELAGLRIEAMEQREQIAVLVADSYQKGSDLNAGADEIVVEEWFTHGVARLDEVRTASGDAILADSIDRLVSAAAVFAIDPAPGISLTPSQAAAYQDLVATHWQRASETV